MNMTIVSIGLTQIVRSNTNLRSLFFISIADGIRIKYVQTQAAGLLYFRTDYGPRSYSILIDCHPLSFLPSNDARNKMND